MVKMDTTKMHTHETGAEFRVGEYVDVEGTRWTPTPEDGEWDAEIVQICLPNDETDAEEGYLILVHPDENISRITRDFSEVLKRNPNGSVAR